MYLTYTSRMMEFRRDGLEEGISIGLMQGREEGAYQNKLETAKCYFPAVILQKKLLGVPTFP